jgi:hypothetical protein
MVSRREGAGEGELSRLILLLTRRRVEEIHVHVGAAGGGEKTETNSIPVFRISVHVIFRET